MQVILFCLFAYAAAIYSRASNDSQGLQLSPYYIGLSIDSADSDMLEQYIVPAVFSWYQPLLKAQSAAEALPQAEPADCSACLIPNSHRERGSDLAIYFAQTASNSTAHACGLGIACVKRA